MGGRTASTPTPCATRPNRRGLKAEPRFASAFALASLFKLIRDASHFSLSPCGRGLGRGGGCLRKRCYFVLCSWLFGSPYDSGGRVEESPQGGRMDAASFSTGHGRPVEKPRNPSAYLPGCARKARHPGCLSLWHCHHLGGYFLLGKQEKVTRPSAEGRKPAAGEQPSHIATTKRYRHWSTSHMAVASASGPRPLWGYAGMASKEKSRPIWNGFIQSSHYPQNTTRKK